MSINYNEIDKNIKVNIINQNISQSKYGLYKSLPLYKPVKILLSQCDIELYEINKIPNVFVINKHSLNIVEEINTTDNLPLVVHVVGSEFDGSSLQLCNGLRDHTFILRTNFNAIVGLDNIFSFDNNECIYTSLLHIIRGIKLNGLTIDNVIPFSMVIAAPAYKRINVTDYVSSDYFIKTISIIDTIFKIAIMKKHSILILTNFGDNDEDKNSTDDIIKIYNLCILKYGHMFKSIIIAISEYDEELYKYYLNNIIIPKNLYK